jgi:hypothetical protein
MISKKPVPDLIRGGLFRNRSRYRLVAPPSTPDEYSAAIDADEKKWAPMVESLNLKFEQRPCRD